MAIPKLSLIPSGVKAGKLYSVLPTNGDGDFTTTRASVATRVNENGLIEEVASNVPRLDYSDGGCPSLLLEPSRTNLIPYSEDFSQWSLDGGTQSVTPNYAVSPDGTQNAYRLQLDKTGVSYSRMYLDAGTIGEKTSSIWIKSNNNSTQNVGLRYDGVGVNLEITSVWKRFELTATSITVSRFQVILLDSIAGNDESCDIQIYGAQLEQGSYSTSYIKTIGTAQTRVADTANGAGNASTFNDSEGVLMAEISALANNSIGSRAIALSDGGGSNRVYFFYDTLNRITVQIISSTVNVFSFTHTLTNQEEVIKLAFNYKANNISLFINGIEIKKDGTVTSMPLNLNRLGFDSGGGFSDFYGNTKQIQYFDSALNDTELEKLTSWTSFTAMANALNYTII